jgi:hypothetical protein
MTKFVLILAALLTVVVPAVFSQEPEAINKIRQYYDDIAKRITAGTLHRRECVIEYPVVPAIGVPVSRIVIYYDMIDAGQGGYRMPVIKIEHYYQHAGSVFYEECLYSQEGDPVFCYTRSGIGDATDPVSVKWNQEARYYFSRNQAIRVMTADAIVDDPRGAVLENARLCLAHAKELLDSVARLTVPKPFSFLNPLP